MKFSTGMTARLAVAAVGGLVLAGTAGAAFAVDAYGDEEVEVSVSIAPATGSGSLSLSVAGTSSSLTEVASGEPEVRRFDGGLPEVTVTDTREAAEIGADRWWYVVGQATDFAGDSGQPAISAGNLGWAPDVIDEGDGLVMEGDQVDTIVDDGPDAVGLVGQELLYAAFDSATLAESGETSWSATAALFLKTGADVAPGDYSSTVTLSLFEDVL
ncbi:hypothetical protein NQ166_02910 [Microbacterium sp. zg.Y1090]|uniref:hypothetical protein n=1 Tax=Microbacterium wangruii TaxID=3049073 RepID=UPI00214B4047|nr:MULTISPECIES: hypothetical protein [unclassified Microbacterium]MCR2817777.1 hypothetical protein [Microbacterium sp. zg.Y1090]MDL5485579.1 hypothetical protein [Microbacterium sp. zg-Y1211]WIM28750.1 hypothetical protein QNO26_02305 [Microbacterium sp. zg-Y1090]